MKITYHIHFLCKGTFLCLGTQENNFTLCIHLGAILSSEITNKKHKHEETETLDRLQNRCLFTLWELKQDVSCLTLVRTCMLGKYFAALLMSENDQESARVLVWGFKEIFVSRQIQNPWLMRINCIWVTSNWWSKVGLTISSKGRMTFRGSSFCLWPTSFL